MIEHELGAIALQERNPYLSSFIIQSRLCFVLLDQLLQVFELDVALVQVAVFRFMTQVSQRLAVLLTFWKLLRNVAGIPSCFGYSSRL